MKHVGIDLSADPRNCGLCILEADMVVHAGRGNRAHQHPDWLMNYCSNARVVAVDVPFGWPKPFIEALEGYEIGTAFGRDRRQYLYRATDAWVTDTLPQHLTRELRSPAPFSVAADKIGVTAMVGAILLNELGQGFHLSPRQGATFPAVIEVYPTLSLWAWALPHRNYRGNSDEALDSRGAILRLVSEAFELEISRQVRETLIRVEHCFDALVAALTAREYGDGRTFDPPEVLSDATLRTEGWTRVPNRPLGEV